MRRESTLYFCVVEDSSCGFTIEVSSAYNLEAEISEVGGERDGPYFTINTAVITRKKTIHHSLMETRVPNDGNTTRR